MRYIKLLIKKNGTNFLKNSLSSKWYIIFFMTVVE